MELFILLKLILKENLFLLKESYCFLLCLINNQLILTIWLILIKLNNYTNEKKILLFGFRRTSQFFEKKFKRKVDFFISDKIKKTTQKK